MMSQASQSDTDRARAFFIRWGLVAKPPPGFLAHDDPNASAMAALAQAFADERGYARDPRVAAPPVEVIPVGVLLAEVGRRMLDEETGRRVVNLDKDTVVEAFLSPPPEAGGAAVAPNACVACLGGCGATMLSLAEGSRFTCGACLTKKYAGWDPVGGRPINPDVMAAAAMSDTPSSGVGRDDWPGLARRAIGLLSDVQRLETAIAGVLDDYRDLGTPEEKRTDERLLGKCPYRCLNPKGQESMLPRPCGLQIGHGGKCVP